ncbi:MAG: hypothetical protein JXB30_17415 [Anaerolineae bacterium]|nr:hypothetical protein [Anaerolineae bacterium]
MPEQERTLTESAQQASAGGWRSALKWGFGIALAHRMILGLWMAIVWVIVGMNMLNLPMDYNPHGAGGLPELKTPLGQLALGLWRRWDARHYLTLAQGGYSINDPGSTVFSPLAPLVIRLLDMALPGPVDIAGFVFGILAFGLALSLLCRFCEVYYQDVALGQQAVLLTAILPISFFLNAPMSDAIYLAMVLGMFYAGTQKHWGLAAVLGALAALARMQGLLLFAVAMLLILERQNSSMSWRRRAIDALGKGWTLILIPLGYLSFLAYRDSLGLPSLNDTYRIYSSNFMTNPIEGILINARWHFSHMPASLLNADFLAILTVSMFLVLQIGCSHHRRLALVAYAVGFSLLFICRINWEYGTNNIIATISFGRYSLSLFPLTILAADKLRNLSHWNRLLLISLLIFALLIYSAQHVLGIGPA